MPSENAVEPVASAVFAETPLEPAVDAARPTASPVEPVDAAQQIINDLFDDNPPEPAATSEPAVLSIAY